MAGSYRHIVTMNNDFRDDIENGGLMDMIDNLGDAREALEECYDMIKYLTNGNKKKIYGAYINGHVKFRYKHNENVEITEEGYSKYWRY